MNIKKITIPLFMIIVTIAASYWIYQRYFAKPSTPFYSTKKVQKRNITHIVKAIGYLQPEDLLKVGSLVNGTIKKMFVDENDIVTKGQLLATINDGKDDTFVRSTKTAYEQANANYVYQKAYYMRQKILYEKNHISQDQFEQVTRDYKTAQLEVERNKAAHEYEVITFNNKKIIAPVSGIIIKKNGSEGEPVTNVGSPPSIVYTIAKDITQMEVKIKIDEGVIGDLKEGMEAELTFDTYPDRVFFGKITEISNAGIKEGGAVNYLATIPLDNSEKLFRPSMNVDAKILIAKKDHVWAVPGYLFDLNAYILGEVAKKLNKVFKPISSEQKNELRKKGQRTLWIERNNAFIEIPVKVGISDLAWYEITKGLNGDEQLITDVLEPDIMEVFFKKYFGRGLE